MLRATLHFAIGLVITLLVALLLSRHYRVLDKTIVPLAMQQAGEGKAEFVVVHEGGSADWRARPALRAPGLQVFIGYWVDKRHRLGESVRDEKPWWLPASAIASRLGSPAPEHIDSVSGILYAEDVAIGWPFPTARYVIYGRAQQSFVGAIVYRRTPEWPADLVLPTIVIWPGLLLNALVFAIGSWLIGTVLGKVLKALRRTKGVCMQCGYRVVGQQRCPECGEGVKGDREAQTSAGDV